MLRFLRPVLAAVLLCFQAPAAVADSPRHAAGAQGAAAREFAATPALWVVRDHDTTIHIFGTSHMLPKNVNWLHGPVREAFDKAGTLVLEIVQPDDPAQVAPLVRKLGFNPKGVTLSSQLTPEMRREIEKAAAQTGLPMAALEPLRPWLAATTLSVAGLQSLGLNSDEGVEQVLTALARLKGKHIEGLETPEQQFGFLASLPHDDQVALLRSSIRDLEGFRNEARALMESWMTGDIETVGNLMNDSLKDSPNLSKVLLTERNARWAEWVKRRMDQPGRVFLAVGAGHLAGPDSLISLLEASGFKVERVTPSRLAAR